MSNQVHFVSAKGKGCACQQKVNKNYFGEITEWYERVLLIAIQNCREDHAKRVQGGWAGQVKQAYSVSTIFPVGGTRELTLTD